LPVTKQKIEWGKVATYKVKPGAEVAWRCEFVWSC